MSEPTIGVCTQCRRRVPAEHHIFNGQVWIRKFCSHCGTNQSLISSDATAWQAKRDLWEGVPRKAAACTLHCDRCRINHSPAMLFLDVTNHCNMDCPICGFSLRKMGFDFNPPLEYFEKIFSAVARMQPRPVVNLFGGEPTVRDDMLEIIAVGRRHGVETQVTTNGLRLADEAYCRKLCQANVGLRLSFDGRSRDIYERLRHNGRAYDLKMKALENLKKYSRRKHTLIVCAALGVNDRWLGDLFQFCAENRELISDVGIIPLYESWEPGVFHVTEHTTAEDVEKMVQAAVPGGDVDFVPAGMTHWLRVMRPFFHDRPASKFLFFAGVHPNCESITFLIPHGATFRGINHYLNRPLPQAAREFANLVRKIEPRLSRLDPGKFFPRWRGKLLCLVTLVPWLLRTIRLRSVFGNRPFFGMIRSVWRLWRRRRMKRLTGRPAPVTHLRVAVLPFEEQHSIDSERMQSCKVGMPYEDVETGRIEVIPHCLWFPYRDAILRKIAQKYGSVRSDREAVSSPPKKAA
ncbi:MAG: radical SAM protein [Pirellulales bacterium]|nr:radical SAM protein [Pirellulales bacterium]